MAGEDSSESEEDVYEVERVVEAVVEKKKQGRVIWNYCVKWKGYSSDENTWEPVESFNTKKTLRIFWKNADTKGRDWDDSTQWRVGDEVYLQERQPEPSSSRGRRRSSTPPLRSSPRKQRAKSESSDVQEAPSSRRRLKAHSPVLRSPDRRESNRNRKRYQGSTEDEFGRSSSRNSNDSYTRRKAVESKRKGKRKAEVISSDDEPLGEESTLQTRKKLKDKVSKSPKLPLRAPRARPKRAYDESDSGDSPPAVRPYDRLQKKQSLSGARYSRTQHEESNRSTTADSLFTDDENEENPTPAKQDNVAVVMPATTADLSRPLKPSIPKQRPTVPAHRAGPRTKFFEDKEIEKQIRARIHGPSNNNMAGGSTNGTTGGPAGTTSARIPHAKEASKLGTGLLTFEKGALGVKRLRGLLAPRPAPKKDSDKDTAKTPIANSGQDDRIGSPMLVENVEPTEQTSATEPMMVDTVFDDLQDTTGHHIDSDNLRDSLFPDSSIVGYNGFDLPSYEEGEIFEAPLSGATGQSIEDGQLKETSKSHMPPPALADLASTSKSESNQSDVAGQFDKTPKRQKPLFLPLDEDELYSPERLDVQSEPTVSIPNTIWPQSIFFSSGFTPDPSSSSFGPRNDNILSMIAPVPDTSVRQRSKPQRVTVGLRLNPYVTVKAILKDVMPASLNSSLTLNSLLMNDMSGPPGKMYPKEVLNAFTTGGSSARLDVSGELSEGEKKNFEMLTRKLAEGAVFIVVLGGHTLVLCSSMRGDICEKLRIPSPLIGLTDIVLVSHVTISDSSVFADFAMKAADLTTA